jgi:hypothetical protein
MAEQGKVFKWLHLRYHEVHGKMTYEERYTRNIRKTGLLPFVHLVSQLTPHMNPCPITTLVDQWKPETHSFHFPCEAMNVTLLDVSIILALPIRGHHMCRSTSSDGWHVVAGAGGGVSSRTCQRWRRCILVLHIPRFNITLRSTLRALSRRWFRCMLGHTCGMLLLGFFSPTGLDWMHPSCGSSYLRVGNITLIGAQRYLLTCTDR